MMRVILPKIRCPYCGHEWTPRKAEITRCPRCKNVLKRFRPEDLLVPIE